MTNDIARRDAWLQPAASTGNAQVDEERERARVVSLWLTSGLRELHAQAGPIDWQREGLHAAVTVNDSPLGDVLTVYTHFREDDFLAWLKTRLKNIIRYGGLPKEEQEEPDDIAGAGTGTARA